MKTKDELIEFGLSTEKYRSMLNDRTIAALYVLALENEHD